MNKLLIYVKFIKYLKSSRVRRLPGKMSLERIAYKILRPNETMVMNVLGLKMQLSPRDRGIFETLVTGGIYEPYEIKLFCNSISQGMTVIDIGANFGYYSLLAAKALKGHGEVYAFEPESESFEMIIENIRLNNFNNIIPIKKGLSDKKAARSLFVDELNLGMHSLVHQEGSSKVVDIETITLDEFIGKLGLPVNLGVLKIDTEGAEGLILKGARSVINKYKPKIFMEYTPDWFEKAGTPALGLLEGLEKMGYGISIIDEKKQELRRICVNELDKMWKSTKWIFQANLLLSI